MELVSELYEERVCQYNIFHNFIRGSLQVTSPLRGADNQKKNVLLTGKKIGKQNRTKNSSCLPLDRYVSEFTIASEAREILCFIIENLIQNVYTDSKSIKKIPKLVNFLCSLVAMSFLKSNSLSCYRRTVSIQIGQHLNV